MVILHNSFLYKYDFLWNLAQISTKGRVLFPALGIQHPAFCFGRYCSVVNIVLSDSVILAQELLEVGAFELL